MMMRMKMKRCAWGLRSKRKARQRNFIYFSGGLKIIKIIQQVRLPRNIRSRRNEKRKPRIIHRSDS